MLAQSRGLSMNKLVQQLSAHALAVLDRLDAVDAAKLPLNTPLRPWIVREQLHN